MLEIDTAALTNREALRYARNVARDLSAGMSLDAALAHRAVPESLRNAVGLIIEANNAGWFPLPAGKGLTYSLRQFGTLRHYSAKAPWLHALIETAERFEGRREQLQPVDRAFGVVALPNWLTEARNAHLRLSRLPLEHVAGGITVELWLRVLQDTQQAALRMRQEMECLSPEWMWDASHSLSEQIARIFSMDCAYLLKAYVSTTRNRHLDHFEAKLLEQIQYHGLSVTIYEQKLREERARRHAEAESSWRLNYQLIHRLASILENITTYHHGTVSRRLKAESNGAFRIVRHGLDGDFAVEIRHQYEIGRGQRLISPFMLVNYCLALSDAIEGQPPTFSAYLDACAAASARVQSIYADEVRATA